MSNTKNTVEVNILGHSYKVACRPEEESNLHLAAKKLTSRMQKFQQGNQYLGLEKLAVIAALNLANDLVLLEEASTTSNNRLGTLNNRFDLVLAELGSLLKSQK